MVLTKQVRKALVELARTDKRRAKRVEESFKKLAADPRNPTLSTHGVRGSGRLSEWGEKRWISYVENQTPAAWRFVWSFGPNADEITVVWLGPHY